MVSLDPALGVVTMHGLLRRVVREAQAEHDHSELKKLRRTRQLGEMDRARIERVVDRQEAQFREKLEITVYVGDTDDGDKFIEHRTTIPRGQMPQRTVRPIVPTFGAGHRTIQLADLALRCYRPDGLGEIRAIALSEKVNQVLTWLVFDPPPTELFEWELVYCPIGIWAPLREFGQDDLVWHDRYPAGGTQPSVMSMFTVNFVFPPSDLAPSVVERNSVGVTSTARRAGGDRWHVTWKDEHPMGRGYYWNLAQSGVGSSRTS